MTSFEGLASYRQCCDRIAGAWPAFLVKREERLAQQRRWGSAAEKVAENILEDLFTTVLDWNLSDFNNQVDYADIVLTRLGIKHLLVEAKRPEALAWNERSVKKALEQARYYADKQLVRSIAVSDGVMLYAGDPMPNNEYHDRVFARLDQPKPPEDLWWLSLDGIYRSRHDAGGALRLLPPPPEGESEFGTQADGALLHPKYQLPAACFAYVGSAADVSTWHLPYLLVDGRPDLKRLAKAIQSILSNYRGAHVTSIPESAIPDVLVTLGRTAQRLGKLPSSDETGPRTYVQLRQALEQLGRLNEVE